MAFYDLDRHDELLGIAFVGKHNPYLPLAEYTDYHGPQRGHAVIDGKIVPLDYETAKRIAQQAHLLALGDPKHAAKMVGEAERAEREQIAA